MKRILKIVIIGFFSLLVLGGAATAVFVATFDPNDYKTLITQKVQEATGRTLTLTGDIELSIFPWLGATVGPMSLSNPQGFGEEIFIKVDNAQLHVALLPLFQKEIRVQKIVFSGASAALQRKKDGTVNWEFAPRTPGNNTTNTAVEGPSSPAAGLGLAALTIDAVEIRNTSFSFDDQQTGQSFAAENMALTTSAIAPGKTIDVAFTSSWRMAEPKLNGSVTLDTQLKLGAGLESVDMSSTVLHMETANIAGLSGRMQLNLQSDIRFVVSTGILTLQKLKVSLQESTLNGSVTVDVAKKAYAGDLTLASPLPNIMNPAAGPSKLALAFQIKGNPKEVTLPQLKGTLDDTTFDGKAAVKNFDRPNINFTLAADTLVLDRYLPAPTPKQEPAKQNPPQSKQGTPAGQPAAAPLSPELRASLRKLTLAGSVALQKLMVNGIQASDITMNAKAQNGVLSIDPLRLNIYAGTVHGKAGVNIVPRDPAVFASLNVAKLQIEEPVTRLAGKKLLSGQLDCSLDITGKGLEWPTLAPSLQGKANLALTQGVLHGTQIIPPGVKQHLKGGSRLSHLDKVAQEQRFESLTATLNITNGKGVNNDLLLTSYDLRGTGAGWIDLPANKIDYRADLHATGLPVIPVTMRGSISAPTYALDAQQFTANILKGVGKQLLSTGDNADTPAKKLKDIKNVDDVGGLLKNMFGRPPSK